MGHASGITGVEGGSLIVMCEKCRDLNSEFRIKLPSDLKKAIAVARENLADGTISNITTGEGQMPFDELVLSGKWDDVLSYHFQCNTCGQLFELSAETYHGAGGWWRPVNKME